MDGRGRVFDNIFVERLWRTVKYEDIYLRDYGSVAELDAGLARYFRFYNQERPHQSLGYRAPAAVHGVVNFDHRPPVDMWITDPQLPHILQANKVKIECYLFSPDRGIDDGVHFG
jgi:putative transposase